MEINSILNILNAQATSLISSTNPLIKNGESATQPNESILYTRMSSVESYLYSAQGLMTSTPAASDSATTQNANQVASTAGTDASQTLSGKDYRAAYLDIIKNRVKFLLEALSQSQDTGNSDPTLQLLQSAATDASGSVGQTSQDYWSPEQTAARIVSFALGFYDGTGDRSEFASMVKDAVMKGYQEAMKAAGGNLPDVANKTISLAMDSIDQFASGNTLNVVA